MNTFEKAAEQDMNSREFNQINEEIKPTSLGKASGYDNDESGPSMTPGYVEIWPENFPSRGLFYNKTTRFSIRAAEVREIRHFSTLNEQDPFSIDEAFNDILKSCLRITQPNRQLSFKDLREEDRIYIIMAIRDLTFPNGENKLIIKNKCGECKHVNEIKITNDSFQRTELSDKIMKYYNEETRQFEIQRDSISIALVPPSIGVMMEITKYIRKRQQENETIDQAFVKILPYLVSDWRGFNEKSINNLEQDFLSWNTKKYQIIYALTNAARVSVKETLITACEKCQSEVTTPISFPGGIKSLFIISDFSDELL